MPELESPTPSRPRSRFLPLLVFVAGCLVSVAAWWLTGRAVHRVNQARFEQQSERLAGMIRARFDIAAQLLNGARAMADASEHLTARRWSTYFNSITGHFDYGVVGLAFAERVHRPDLEAFEARVRAEGVPDFKVERTAVSKRCDRDEVNAFGGFVELGWERSD